MSFSSFSWESSSLPLAANHLEERNASGFDAPKAAFAPLRWAKLRPDELRWVGPLSSERKKNSWMDGKTWIDPWIKLMVQKSGDHQLRLVVVVFIYKVLAPSQMVQDFFHQQSTINSITRSWNRPSIWYTYVCFNWMIVPSLRMENGWKSSFPSIEKKNGWLSGTKFIILMA